MAEVKTGFESWYEMDRKVVSSLGGLRRVKVWSWAVMEMDSGQVVMRVRSSRLDLGVVKS